MADKSVASDLLEREKGHILDEWEKELNKDERIGELIQEFSDELREDSDKFLKALANALSSAGIENLDNSEFTEAEEILTNIAIKQQQHQISPVETASSILTFKEVITPIIEDEFSDDPELRKKKSSGFSKLIDTLSLRCLEGIIDRREKTIRQQSRDIVELSTPVIRVWKGIVTAPLIGTLDSERTQHFKEVLLKKIVETESPVALIDITGVPQIDTQTAHHLIETIKAVNLLGAEVILTGVLPSIAQTLVHLGIELPNITTCSSLQDGLRIAFEKLNLEVVPS